MLRNISLAIIAASLLIFPILLFAQEGDETPTETTLTTGTGIIRGTVVDTSPNRNPIEAADISYVGPGVDNRGTVVSGEAGDYEITGLVSGQYLLTSEKSKHATREMPAVTVVVGNDTVVEIKMRKKDTPITYFQKMGIIGWPLALCSILAVTFIIERAYTLVKSRSRIGTEQFMSQIAESLRNDNVMEAVSTCETAGGPLANVLKAGLLKYSQAVIEEKEVTKEEIREAIEEAGLLEIPQLERNLPVIGTIAVISPLLGLLGTVAGMIKAFTVIALEGTGDPQQLAGGISMALLTTAVGLGIAIPCLIAHQTFESQITRRVLDIEQASTEMINALLLRGSTGSSSSS